MSPTLVSRSLRSSTRKFAWVVSALFTMTAHAQSAATAETVEATATSSPVAFVYVSSSPTGTGGANEINAFAAAANGRLTAVPGSPFRDDVTSMAVNGKYLFGSTRSGIYVAAFLMEPNGALHWTTSTNIVQYNLADCGSSALLVLDHMGADLYDLEYRADCANNAVQSFSVQKTNGLLHKLGDQAGASRYLQGPLSFTANNLYAYTFTCVPGFGSQFSGFKRGSSGVLSDLPSTMPIPQPKAKSDWCISYTAADRTNHLATTLQPVVSPVTPYVFDPNGPAQLATYTVDAAGNLSTTSTVQNMPATNIGILTDINMSPSGKLLAVAGDAGLQVFHFNGASPITHYTGPLVKGSIGQVFWDNANHLYAISNSKLYVFSVALTSFSQAPGSPYTIAHTQSLIVQPKTPVL